jgi:hypothetical protein
VVDLDADRGPAFLPGHQHPALAGSGVALPDGPVGIDPTYSEVPRSLAIPSGWKPSGRRMVSGDTVAPAVAGRTAIAAMASRTSARRTGVHLGIIGPPCR